MKPFAFLRKTPNWAKQNNCGQFNGYIAFDKDELFDLGLAWANYDNDCDFESYDVAEFAQTNVAPSEVTYMKEQKLDEIGAICPISAIPEEAFDKMLFVIGFNTCHIGNSWDNDIYDSVKSETLEWLEKVIKIMDFYKAHIEVIREEL